LFCSNTRFDKQQEDVRLETINLILDQPLYKAKGRLWAGEQFNKAHDNTDARELTPDVVKEILQHSFGIFHSFKEQREYLKSEAEAEARKWTCDNCKKDMEGEGIGDASEVFQDKTGNTFVCLECFNSSNDGHYFIEPVVKDKRGLVVKCIKDYIITQLLPIEAFPAGGFDSAMEREAEILTNEIWGLLDLKETVYKITFDKDTYIMPVGEDYIKNVNLDFFNADHGYTEHDKEQVEGLKRGDVISLDIGYQTVTID
jgi:hypothetical protein